MAVGPRYQAKAVFAVQRCLFSARRYTWHVCQEGVCPERTRRLTLPSRGRPTGYALRPPLKSIVRRRKCIARKAPVYTSSPSIRARETTGIASTFPRSRKRSSSSFHAWLSAMSRRAVRPAAARARAVYAQAESGQTRDVQRPLGTCHRHSSSGTLSSMVRAPFFQSGFKSTLCCSRPEAASKNLLVGSALFVLGSSVRLARIPSRCPPRKNAPPNPSIERTAKQLRCLSAAHVKR